MTATLNRSHAAGFTLMELVTIIVIVSILGAMALPRFVGGTSFDVFGFSEQLSQTLRLAQKMAQASRRTTCVTIAASGVTLQRSGTVGSATCDTVLPNPVTNSTAALKIPGGVLVTETVIRFNAQGQPVSATGAVFSAQQDIVISGEHSRIVSIAGETGYVH